MDETRSTARVQRCRICGVDLAPYSNWYPSMVITRSYICKGCHIKKVVERRKGNAKQQPRKKKYAEPETRRCKVCGKVVTRPALDDFDPQEPTSLDTYTHDYEAWSISHCVECFDLRWVIGHLERVLDQTTSKRWIMDRYADIDEELHEALERAEEELRTAREKLAARAAGIPEAAAVSGVARTAKPSAKPGDNEEDKDDGGNGVNMF
jgi:hypothetical protein